MQGMIQGDGPKLLSMIQQFAPSFRDAGISADQLVAIIQNSEGGIFTDQNMNAIVMGIKNIRLMTDATSQSLKQVGIDGEDMTRKLNDGSMTIFQALRQVAQAIDNTGSSSQAAGQVMQNVFGRQGAMAGTKLGEAIANLNTNLEETKTQTGGLGESLANLERAQESLNNAMRDTFGMDGWEEMSNTIKSELLTALADTIKGAQDVGRAIAAISNDVETVISPVTSLTKKIIDFGDFGVSAATAISVAFSGLLGPLGSVLNLLRSIGGSAGGAYDKALDAYEKQQQQAADRQQFTITPPPGYKPPKSGNGSVFTSKPTGGNRRTGRTGSKTTPPPTPDELASKEVEQAKERYRQEVVKATQNYANGMATEDEYQKKINDVLKQLYDAYNTIYAKYGRGTEAENMELLAGQISENNKPIPRPVSMDGIITAPVSLGIDEKEMEAFGKKIKDYFKKNPLGDAGKSVTEEWQNAAKAIQAVGSAMSGIEDPAAKVLGTIAQAVATIALGYAEATKQAATMGPWAWVAFAATGLATMISSISAVKSATSGYAQGGIVPGNSFNDQLRTSDYGISSGELILNKAQQGIIASQLEGGGMQGMVLDTQISAEAIRIVLNNNGRRTRRGEYVTTKKYGS
jgi:ABC-type transporter Mla subunit MlaD